MLRWLALAALVAAGCVSAADAQQYDSSKDFNTLSTAGNTNPAGLWSDGATTMWVADHVADKIFAYHTSNMSRYPDNDFPLDAGNTSPFGLWSNGTIMWVSDFGQDKIFAYRISDKSRVPSAEFNNTKFASDNTNPVGLWSDGTTMWVGDQINGKIFAYHTSNMSRDMSKEFSFPHNYQGLWSDGTTMWVPDATNGKIFAYHTSNMSRDMSKEFSFPHNYQGLWSDGTTMWVPDATNGKIFAYKMSDRLTRDSKEFDTLIGAGNNLPSGIWSDGATMWVADIDDNKIYAYKMHPAPTTSSPRVFVYVPPPDTTPPTVKSVERTGNATTTDHTLTWNVRFSESVRVGLAALHTNYTSVANATIPDLGMAHDTMLVDVPGAVTGGSVSADVHHPITSGLLIELVAPDCTRFVIHNQTTTFLYKLRQQNDLGDLAGVGAAGQWTLHVDDRAKYWNGTLNGWTLYLESEGVVEGGGRTHTITQYVAGPGNYTLSLDGYDIRDRAGNHLVDTDTAVNEPYHVVGAAARTCQTE